MQDELNRIFSENLLYYMKRNGDKQVDIANLLGITRGTVSQYCSGKAIPRIKKIDILAKHFGIDRSDLLDKQKTKLDIFSDPRILPIEKKKIPLLGGIACGEPVFHEEFESYVEANTNVKADFALKAIGDSMVNIGIKDGYIVFIRQQPAVDNGEVAAVNIDGEFTLKRVYNYGNILVLRAENPDFPDMEYKEGDADNIVILGKAVAFQGDVR